MHDYHKAKDIVKEVESMAKKQGKDKVKKVTIIVGDSSGYSADTIRMFYEEISMGTICENVELEIKPVRATLQCPSCGVEFERKLMQYKCPACGEEGVPSKTGTEVRLESILFE